MSGLNFNARGQEIPEEKISSKNWSASSNSILGSADKLKDIYHNM